MAAKTVTLTIESASISSSEETKKSLHVNVRVPQWPYDEWKLSEKTAEDTEIRSPRHSKPTMAGPVFVKFLELFSNQLDVLTSSESKEILNDITTLLRKSLEDLGKCHKCFEKCRLIQAGSVAEKTKVGEPNEFDFLIVLDYFSNKELFKLKVRKHDFMIYVKQPANVDDLPFIMCDALKPEGVGYIDNSLRSQFMEMLLQIIDKYLPSGWRRVKVENKVICCSGIACTLHLVSEKFNLNVDVDLCPCLKIDVDDFEGALVMPEDVCPLDFPFFSEQVLFFNYIKDILEITKLELFAILGEGSYSTGAISTRITAPLLELSCFHPYGAEDGRLKAYCITKCVLSCFLPKLTTVFGCKCCCHKLIRSYHVKNIFFYMLKNYEEDIYWQDEKVPLRVLEIFLILRQCMDLSDEESSNDAAISTFCLPGTLYLVNVTNSSPSYVDGNGGEFFFTPDSHKPRYQLSSSPVFEEYLTTGNDEADCALKEWFNTLNNKLWNSKQLLQDLITLLVSSKDATDLDVLRKEHRFIWNENEASDKSWEERLAKKYYDRLFKEYCIADLSRYKENKIALRWRIEKEVIEGKGQFICGNKKCQENEGLKSWEVNFCYEEQGEKKNALVKLRLCPDCSYKLNYHHQRKLAKQKKKEDKEKEKREKRSKSKKKRKHKRKDYRKNEDNDNYSSSSEEEKSNEENKTSSHEKSGSREERPSTSRDDEPEDIWKGPAKVQVDKSREEEFEDYFQDMFL